jgi:hypothetical protein
LHGCRLTSSVPDKFDGTACDGLSPARDSVQIRAAAAPSVCIVDRKRPIIKVLPPAVHTQEDIDSSHRR